MCGRFTLRACPDELLEEFDVRSQLDWTPRFNIAPTQAVAVLRNAPAGDWREAAMLRWGLVPSWADDLRIGSRLINARAETVVIKPAFRDALERRRCLVLADGFYEWKRSGKTREPYFIARRDGRPFVFAGLWERWTKVSPAVESCTILTTSPNALLAELHDRMPVILSIAAAQQWLDAREKDTARLAALLAPCPDAEWITRAVGPTVNSPHHDSPACIQPPKMLF